MGLQVNALQLRSRSTSKRRVPSHQAQHGGVHEMSGDCHVPYIGCSFQVDSQDIEEDMRNGTAVSEEGPAEDGPAAGDRAANVAGFSGRLGPQQLIDRTDYLRLLQQAMRKLGYKATAERLEHESVSSCQKFHSLSKNFGIHS